MKTIGIIILNYIAYEETKNCIKSFREQYIEGFDYRIVIVDNNSPNESVAVLEVEYGKCYDVDILKMDRNEGFARGNNAGYYFLKERYSPDFYIFCNDDIVLKSFNISKWINDTYEKYEFAVLGPQIYSVNGDYFQSPSDYIPNDIKNCWKNILKREKQIYRLKLKNVLGYDEPIEIVRWENPYYKHVSDTKMLHGSFLVFSEIYFRHYEEPFDSRTFLYGEELILKLRCDRKNIKMVYEPNFMVFHMQNMSTILDNNTDIRKKISRLRYEVESLKIFAKELRKKYE